MSMQLEAIEHAVMATEPERVKTIILSYSSLDAKTAKANGRGHKPLEQQIDDALTSLQCDGYALVDIRFQVIVNDGDTERWAMLIGRLPEGVR